MSATMGAVNNRKDASVHIPSAVNTCRVITRVNDNGVRVQRRELVKANGPIAASRVCRWCSTPENLDAANIDNTTGPDFSVALDDLLVRLGLPSKLSTAGFNPAYDAEREAIHAAAAAPVETPAKPTFATVLANYGGRHNGAHFDKLAARKARRTHANAA